MKYTTSTPVAKQGKTVEYKGMGAVAVFISTITTTFFLRFLLAWELMLVIGAAHAELDSRIPAYGYWGVFFGLWIVSFFKGVLTSKPIEWNKSE